MTAANLGFKIDSSQASSAAADLDKLYAAAAKMETAADSLTSSAGALSNALKKVGDETKKVPPAAKPFQDQDAHVRAFRAEMERLTMAYQPLARETRNYETRVSDLQRAHRMGIISAQQMTQQIDRERMAYERLKTSATTAGAAVKAANANAMVGGPRAGSSGAERAAGINAGYQFQDIAVTAAMGMNPLMIGLQQGTQLASVVGSMERPVAGLAAAFGSLISPVSLITIGLTAGTAALVQYFMTAESGTETTNRLFNEQNDIIRNAAQLWGDAVPSLKAYVDQLDRVDKITQGREAADILAGRELEGLGEKLQGIQQQFSEAMRGLRGLDADPAFLRDFSQAFGDLRERLDDGTASVADYNRVQAVLAEAVERYGITSVLKFRDAFDQNTASIRKSIEAAKQARSEWIAALAGGTNVQDILSNASFTDNGQALRTADFIPRNPAVPGRRPNIELSGDKDSSALSPHLTGLLGGSGSSDLFSPATQSANALNTAVGGVSTTLQTVNSNVIDVTHSLTMAKVQQLTALEQTRSNLRSMQKQVTDINTALKDAANIPPSELFGGLLSNEAGSAAIATAATNIEKLFTALKNGNTTAVQMHEGIELIRQSLKAMGGDAAAVDRFIDSMVAGRMEVLRLDGTIKQLSASIMNIPNKVVSIGIQQYTVPSSGGGTKGINVYGSGADFSYQGYDVGGGKTVGVSAGNGAYRQPGYLVEQSDLQTMYDTLGYGGARAAGGPVDGGKTYLVGENGPELLTMAGSGNVTNAGATASILSGGRDTLSLIEDHLYNVVQELRIHTNYFETFESDFMEMVACLKSLKTASSGSSYSSGSSSSSSRGSYSSGSSSSGQSHLDPSSPYYFNAARNFAGRGGGRYDPVADAMLNGNISALRGVSGGPTQGISNMLSESGMPSLLERLKKQYGFATGGQIMPGEEQKVEFFKRNKERVIIVDDDKVSDQRGSGATKEQTVIHAPISVTFQGDTGDPRSRQSVVDDIRRTVLQVMQGQMR